MAMHLLLLLLASLLLPMSAMLLLMMPLVMLLLMPPLPWISPLLRWVPLADAVACGMAADPIDDVDYDNAMSINHEMFLFADQVSHRMGAVFGTPNAKRNMAEHGGNRRKAARAKRGG